MIDLRRPGQRSFGEGLIEEATTDLWEPWMRQADKILEDEQLVNAVYEALWKPRPKSRGVPSGPGRRGVSAEISATGVSGTWSGKCVPTSCTGSLRASAPARYQMPRK